MTATTTLNCSPVESVATTSMMFGPASNLTVVEKIPRSLTGTDTPLTLTTALGDVRPERGTGLPATMLWFVGSVTTRNSGNGGSASEVTVSVTVF